MSLDFIMQLQLSFTLSASWFSCMSLDFIVQLQLKRDNCLIHNEKERLHEWKIPHAKAVQPAQTVIQHFPCSYRTNILVNVFPGQVIQDTLSLKRGPVVGELEMIEPSAYRRPAQIICRYAKQGGSLF